MPEEKLNKLYFECIQELQSIGIDMQNEKLIGTIDITISKRNNKRYGCCKQENKTSVSNAVEKCRTILKI